MEISQKAGESSMEVGTCHNNPCVVSCMPGWTPNPVIVTVRDDRDCRVGGVPPDVSPSP